MSAGFPSGNILEFSPERLLSPRDDMIRVIQMREDEVYERVRQYLIREFEISRERIAPEANLFEDLELDSIDALDWFAKMESEIDLPIVEKELKEIRTVQDVVDYVLRNLR